MKGTRMRGEAVAEAMVAGGVLMGGPDALARVRARIRPAMFHDPRLAEVFRVCADLADQGVLYDAGVVFAAADSDKVTAEEIAALLDTVPTAANIEWHAGRVVEEYARRKSLDVVRDLGDVLATSPPNGFVRTAVGRLEALHVLAVPRTEDAPATLADWWKADRPLPAPIIGREGQSGAVLVQGQSMLLSGAGGTGKSRAALQLALARGAAVASGQPWAVTMGLRVAAGPTVFASWEDVGEVAAVRSRNIVREALASDDQRVFGVSTDGMAAWTPDPEAQPEIGRHVAYRYGTDPLFAAPDGWTPPAPTPAWDRLWRLVDDTAPDGGRARGPRSRARGLQGRPERRWRRARLHGRTRTGSAGPRRLGPDRRTLEPRRAAQSRG